MAALPAHVTGLARTLFEDHSLSNRAIARRIGVDKSTVSRWRGAYYATGRRDLHIAQQKRGRKRVLSDEQEEWMLSFLEDRPDAYQDEIALALSDQFDIVVSDYVVQRALKKRRWSKKVAKRRVLESTAPMRALWQTKRANWAPEQLVFIDESGANERTGWRKRGWSPKGVGCSSLSGTKRSERWSILPAMTINGWLKDSTLVYQGSINWELFIQWLDEKVMPKLQPQYHILVMDNCAIHHGQEVLDLCEQRGFEIQYLPPYSPDYNPIEYTFNTFKIWLKRHFEEHTRFEDFGDFLRYAIDTTFIDDSDATSASYFTHCGYVAADDQPS
nr:hypothetical protein CFP56_02537 [Quercus suber]